jgi:hypothetical protein
MAGRFGLWGALVLAAVMAAGCSSFIKGERLPGTDGAYYALPRGIVPLSLARDKCALTLTPPPKIDYVPDPQAQYRLRLDHHAFAKDTLIVETDPAGLLKTVNGTADDQFPQVLEGLVQLVGVFQGAAPKAPLASADKSPCEAMDFAAIKMSVDPTIDGNAVPGAAGEGLHVLGIKITAEPLDPVQSGVGGPVPNCMEVVCFRPARAYIIKVRQEHPLLQTVEHRLLVTAPDPTIVLGVKLERQPFVSANVTLGFQNGMLTSYQTTKHSEVVSALQLPLNVGAAIIGVFSEVATINVKHVQREKALVDAQTAYLKAQAELIAEQQKLLKVQQDAAAQGSKP